jgi:hypothetical protein
VGFRGEGVKGSTNYLRGVHGDRGVRLRIAHAKDAKALLRSLSAGSLSFAGFAEQGPAVAGPADAWGACVRNETLLLTLIRA